MKTGKVLVAEDQGTIRTIIGRMLKGHHEFDLAENGLIAWTLLEKNPEAYHVVVLDRNMPEMSGMEVLEKMKKHDHLKSVPVIFQTSLGAENEILEGLEAGAYYYLTKPFKEEQLLSIVEGAYSDYERYETLQNEVRKNIDVLHTLSLMTKGNMAFQYRTISEGDKLSSLLANTCPVPESVVSGLMELFINAVEHGNLNISYEEKTTLVGNGRWQAEVDRRLELPENASKKVDVQFKRTEKEISFYVRDQGKGFEWEPFLEFSTGERAFHNHGRGIAMANKLSFDSVEYLGNGNKVLAMLKIQREGSNAQSLWANISRERPSPFMMGVQNEKMNGKPSDKQRDKILDAIADGVFTVDRDNNITFFNRAAEKIIGISRNQAVGHKCFDVFRANICQTACALGKTIETGRNLINLNINPSLTLFSQKATKNG